MALFWLLLALQDPQATVEASEPAEPPKLQFVPIQAGNVVDAGGFKISVPPGFFLAVDESAPAVYKTLGIKFVPNCKGIFISDQDDRSYYGILQHFPYQPSTLEPRKPPEYFTQYFSRRHLYYHRLVIGTCETVLPPTYNDAEQSFSIGLHYPGKDNQSTVYLRKVWVTDQEAMVLSVRATGFDNYRQNEDLILSLLDMVAHVDTDEPPLDLPKESYLTFVGVDPVYQAADAEVGGVPLGIKLTSATLVLLAVTLLLIARKKHREVKATAEEQTADAASESTERTA